MSGESAPSIPWVAIGERAQMLKAAIVGLGWWAASSASRSPPARNATPSLGYAFSRTRPYRAKAIVEFEQDWI